MVKTKTSQTPLEISKKDTSKPCPKLLRRLIEVVNIIPPEIELEAVSLMRPDYSRYDEWIDGRYQQLESNLEKAKEQLKNLDHKKARMKAFLEHEASQSGLNLEPLSVKEVKITIFLDTFRSYLRMPEKQAGMGTEHKRQAIENYNRFVTEREKLRLLANSKNLIGQHEWYLPMQGGTKTVLDKDGNIQIELDDFSKAIKGMEVSRIRECLNCRRIFWAGKSNQEYCTKRCSDSYRSRKHYGETGKQKRIQKAQQKEENSKGQL